MDGTYQFDKSGAPSLLKGSPATRGVFRQLYGILRDKSIGADEMAALAEVAKAQQLGRLSNKEAGEAAASIDPRFADLIRGQESGWLALIFAILAFFYVEYANGRDHKEVMASLERNYEQELRQYNVEQDQLEALQSLVARSTTAPLEKVCSPPPGHRTKRQARRDRRFNEKSPPAR